MSRKRKRHDPKPEAGQDQPTPAPKVGTALGELLKQAGVKAVPPAKAIAGRGPRTLPPPGPDALRRISERPPSAGPRATQGSLASSDLRILNDAYAGAKPLGTKTVRRPGSLPTEHAELQVLDRAAEGAARARLDALVAGGVRFQVQRQDEHVQGLRAGASTKLLTRVTGKGFAPEATLDLHGKRSAEITRAVSDFVRSSHRKGARHLLIIAGKGLHSEGGVGVLRDAAVEALTQGGAAPLVTAFASAHAAHGGSGALAVLLES